MFNHPSLRHKWHKTTVETAPNSSRVSMWLPTAVMDDPKLHRQMGDAIISTFVVGVVGDKPTPEKIRNRQEWGQRLGSGQEGSVFRLRSMPDHVAKIFKPGRGINTDNSNGIEAHRAGKSVMAHAVLHAALAKTAQYTTPSPKAIAVHPDSKRAVTIIEYVDGERITDSEATIIHEAVNQVLYEQGMSEPIRERLLHDVKENGGNVLKHGSSSQDSLFPVYSLIDR